MLKLYNSEFCRKCSHNRDSHLRYIDFDIEEKPIQHVCYGNEYEYSGAFMQRCRCPEYIPKDNIEYLEYLVEKESPSK